LRYLKFVLPPLAVIALFLVVRVQAGWEDIRPLFRDYQPDSLISIGRSGTGDRLVMEEGRLYQTGEGIDYPVREEWSDYFRELPLRFTANLAGRLREDADWLPPGRTTLTYRYGKNKTLVLELRYPTAPEEGEGLFLLGRGRKSPVYFLADGNPLLPGERDLRDRRLFPELKSGGDIITYRLSTPRRGDGASLYNYVLEKQGDSWIYTGRGEENPLKEAEVHLLMLSLAGAEGSGLREREEGHPGEERFRIEIGDNRGNRYILVVGDREEVDGEPSYLAVREGGTAVFLVSRDTLTVLAPPLNRLLDL